jgi:hypothetical protein
VRRCIRRPPGEVPGILPPLPPGHLPWQLAESRRRLRC